MNVYNFQGDKIPSNTVFIIKHLETGEHLAVFSTMKKAQDNRHNITAFSKDETFIQETIVDYYVSK